MLLISWSEILHHIEYNNVVTTTLRGTTMIVFLIQKELSFATNSDYILSVAKIKGSDHLSLMGRAQFLNTE